MSKKQAVNRACLQALYALNLNPEIDEDENETQSSATEEEDEEMDTSLDPEEERVKLTEEELLFSWPKTDYKSKVYRIAKKIYNAEPTFVSLERVER